MVGEDGWEFGHLLLEPDADDVKQKHKTHETIPSRLSPEQKTKKSFGLRHLCPVHEVLTGVWKLLSGQIVNSFGHGRCTFDYQSGNVKNYAMSQRAHAC